MSSNRTLQDLFNRRMLPWLLLPRFASTAIMLVLTFLVFSALGDDLPPNRCRAVIFALATIAGIALAVEIILSILFALRFCSSISNPIRALSGTAASRLQSDPNVSFASHSEIAEIQSLETACDTLFKTQDTRIEELVGHIHSMRHTLLNQLSNIMGYGELVRDSPRASIPSQQRLLAQSAAGIIDGVETATRLIDDLASIADDYNRISGKPDSETDIRQAVSDAVLNHRRPAEDKDIAISVRFHAETISWPVHLHAIAEILDNLIGNAVKYTPCSGRIAVSTERSGEKLLIRVSDTGPGVPESERESIFRLGFRGSSSDGTPGTGLGLARVASTLSRYGGSCRCEPNDEHGATFTVELPPLSAERQS